ncbi:MAG: Crp/Fnr family transcriptional regulator [Saprospiraceae bacterium]
MLKMIEPQKRIVLIIQPYLFRNSFILKELPINDLNILKKYAQSEVRRRGEILFREGAFPKGAYWLVSGKVKICQGTEAGQRQTHYIYSDEDLIGYRQLIAEEPNPVTAVLLEDSTVNFIPAETFRGLLKTSPVFARNVLSALASEFSVWMNRMTGFKKFSVRHRLVLTLLILYVQYQRSGLPEGLITMTRTELAEYVGATLETVVRSLNKLKANKLVQINGRRIQVLNPNAMIDILSEEKKDKNKTIIHDT